jgi:capsular polysaccharide biosynthesis protein
MISLVKRWYILALSVVLIGALGFIVYPSVRKSNDRSIQQIQTTNEIASEILVVLQANPGTDTIDASKKAIPIISRILLDDQTIDGLQEHLLNKWGLDLTTVEIESMISFRTPNESPIFNIKVTSEDEQLAIDMNNYLISAIESSIRSFLPVETYKILTQPINTSEVANKAMQSSIDNFSTRFTGKRTFVGIFAIVGFIIGVMAITFIDFIKEKNGAKNG